MAKQEKFKDSYYGKLVYDNEKVTINGNNAKVSGVDKNGNPYANYFKRANGTWRFNGYSGSGGQVSSTKPKYPKNNNAVRPDSKAQQAKRLGNNGK